MNTQTRDTLDRLYMNILNDYQSYSFWVKQNDNFDLIELRERLIKYDLKRMLAIKLESMMQNMG